MEGEASFLFFPLPCPNLPFYTTAQLKPQTPYLRGAVRARSALFKIPVRALGGKYGAEDVVASPLTGELWLWSLFCRVESRTHLFAASSAIPAIAELRETEARIMRCFYWQFRESGRAAVRLKGPKYDADSITF